MSRVNKSFMIGESRLVLECFSSSFVSLIGENSLADGANRRSTGVLGRDLWDFTLLTKHKHERAKYEIYSDSKVNFTTRLEQNVEVTFAHGRYPQIPTTTCPPVKWHPTIPTANFPNTFVNDTQKCLNSRLSSESTNEIDNGGCRSFFFALFQRNETHQYDQMLLSRQYYSSHDNFVIL